MTGDEPGFRLAKGRPVLADGGIETALLYERGSTSSLRCPSPRCSIEPPDSNGTRPSPWADATLRVGERLDLAVLGGCCGPGPHHLQALAARLTGEG